MQCSFKNSKTSHVSTYSLRHKRDIKQNQKLVSPVNKSIHRPEPSIQSQHPEPRVQSPASRVQHPQPSVQSPASRVQRPNSSVQSPVSNTCVQSPGILVCPLAETDVSISKIHDNSLLSECIIVIYCIVSGN